MRVFIAGGTGAIGRPLVAALVAAGHDVAVFSRRAERVTALGVPGVVPAVGDAFDSQALMGAVRSFGPDVVINELTSLPVSPNPLALKRGFDATSRLRRDVSEPPSAGWSGLACVPRIARGLQAPGQKPSRRGVLGSRRPPGRSSRSPSRRDPRSASPPAATGDLQHARRTRMPAPRQSWKTLWAAEADICPKRGDA